MVDLSLEQVEHVSQGRSKSENADSKQVETRFTLFPELPKEIRLEIWASAMPGPRLVFIKQQRLVSHVKNQKREPDSGLPPYGHGDVEQESTSTRAWRTFRSGLGSEDSVSEDEDAEMIGIACKTPVPYVFLACKESYSVAAKLYKRTFARTNSNPETYFNFEQVTLCLDGDDFSMNVIRFFGPFNMLRTIRVGFWQGFRQEDDEDVGKVERLGIRVAPNQPFFHESAVADVLKIFHGVKELFFILEMRNDHEHMAASDSYLLDPPESDILAEAEFHGIDPNEFYITDQKLNMTMLRALEERHGCWTLPYIAGKILGSGATGIQKGSS
ncbi:uncharacterized protein LY89DRAFT_724412 [Mollisia scopiformis]|uniref:2EXR domain-containing protein n=1 Tax=Mollisia scopiformis TaxID=149040 RepID=A0A132BAJ8_MOLSC|nr:uncharacterized protein LY89DRAFT_724412 [Mollisia scopiformis]KUJ09416.1 hypothetical protein LY89DRAFT_724412 [Mollisia scopiformis]